MSPRVLSQKSVSGTWSGDLGLFKKQAHKCRCWAAHSVRTQYYREGDRPGLRATPAFVSHNCTTFITKRGTRWYEEAWREGRGGADVWKMFHLGRWSWHSKISWRCQMCWRGCERTTPPSFLPPKWISVSLVISKNISQIFKVSALTSQAGWQTA